MKRLKWWGLFGVVAAIFGLAGSVGAVGQWPFFGSLTDLGVLGMPPGWGYGLSYGRGINDLGQVVGWSTTNTYGIDHAFLWTPEIGLQDLGTPTGSNRSYGVTLNNAGRVAVNYFDGATHAYVLAEGQWRKLGVPADWCESVVNGINADGLMVGRTQNPGTNWRACVWTAEGAQLILDTLGGQASEALAINDLGWVVGNSRTPQDTLHAFLWKPGGTMQDLGTLGEDTYSIATGINDRGWIVGYSWGKFEQAVMWSPTGTIIPLGFLPNGWSSRATGINNRGEVTGWSNAVWDTGLNKYEVTHAFIYTGGMMRDLGTCDKNPLRGSWAYAINNKSQIAGEMNAPANVHAFFGVFRSPAFPPIYLDLLLY